VDEIALVESEIATYRERIAKKEAEGELMRIKAPIAGTVCSPTLRPSRTPSEGALASWAGSPFDAKNERVFLQSRDEFCMIADPQKLRAILAIDQEGLPFIKRKQKVTMIIDALTDMTFEGEIAAIAPREMQATDPSLSNQAGGGLATRKDPDGIERPLSSTYQALVPLDNEDGLLKVGFRGKAKIRAGYQTLGSRLWTYLTRTFHFYL
jgi:putative peptide zinc metalloprotease protein